MYADGVEHAVLWESDHWVGLTILPGGLFRKGAE